MRLRQLFEGGNLSIGDVSANRIDASKRTQVVPMLDRTLKAINQHFAKFSNGTPLWNEKLLKSREFLSGSSFSFFNIPKNELVEYDTKDVSAPKEKPIPTQQFVKRKPSVGDIDTQVNAELKDTIRKWLSSLSKGTKIGDAVYVGAKPSGEQFITLWTFPSITMTGPNGEEIPTNIQIDLELKQFDGDAPTSWSRFSAYSSWDDMESGIKGVFHKYLIQALTTLTRKEFALRKMKGRGANRTEVDEPVTDNMISFAVSSKEGGGLRTKYEPVLDDSGKQIKSNGLPVYRARPTTGYEQNIRRIFSTLFDTKMSSSDIESASDKFWSFTGLADLINQYLDEEEQNRVMEAFSLKLFGKGAQGLYKGDPEKDREEKLSALNKAYEIIGNELTGEVKKMVDDYYSSYKTESINEEVAVSKRQGVQHLEKMKDVDFLDLLDELKDETGENFRLDRIPMTLKIDGLGGRFGKSADGVPFFESSRSGPITKPGAFTAHMRRQGVDDEVKMDRAVKYDKLFDEVMDTINDIDAKLGKDYLKNVKVHCEILFRPMAVQEGDKLKFVSVAYDNLPEGIELALVPLFIETADTGETHPENDEIKAALNKLGRLDKNAMFIDNSLNAKDIDVTAIIRPLENIDALKAMATGRSRKDKQEVKQILQPVKDQLAKEIVQTPNILGKYKLGKDYEGIIIYTKKGPVKITSPEFKKMMSDKVKQKQDAQAKAPRGKKCIVGYGSLMGHKGHQMLVNAVLQKAKQTGRTPFIYISPMVGPEDPVTAETKKATFQKLYPEYKDAFRIVGSGAGADGVVRSGGVRGAIKFDLVPEGYTDVVIMTGEDQQEAFKFLGTEKSLKATGADSVQTMIRQEAGATEKGVRSTELRNVLKDPKLTYDQKLDKWMIGFDGQKLGREWVEKVMQEAAKNMGIDLKIESEPKKESVILKKKLLKAYGYK